VGRRVIRGGVPLSLGGLVILALFSLLTKQNLFSMLAGEGGVSEPPKPGCSGTISSKVSASLSMNGSQADAPRAPCRKIIGAPLPPRIRRVLHLLTVSKDSCPAIVRFLPSSTDSFRRLTACPLVTVPWPARLVT
jgi:hypothetical protein